MVPRDLELSLKSAVSQNGLPFETVVEVVLCDEDGFLHADRIVFQNDELQIDSWSYGQSCSRHFPSSSHQPHDVQIYPLERQLFPFPLRLEASWLLQSADKFSRHGR